MSEIRRWENEPAGLLRLSLDFKLVRIADGALEWQRKVQKLVPASRSGNPADAHRDAVKAVATELF